MITNLHEQKLDDLVHHGVKGQKWGVRKYKETRSEAKVHQKAKDGFSSAKYKAERVSDQKRVKLDNATKRLGAAKHTNNLVGSKRTARKVERLTNKQTNASDKLAISEVTRRTASNRYNKSQYQYQKRVNAAAKLPISVAYRPRTSAAKAFIDNGLKNALASAVVNVATGTNTKVIVSNASKTRNDRFAESVRNAQINNANKKK